MRGKEGRKEDGKEGVATKGKEKGKEREAIFQFTFLATPLALGGSVDRASAAPRQQLMMCAINVGMSVDSTCLLHSTPRRRSSA